MNLSSPIIYTAFTRIVCTEYEYLINTRIIKPQFPAPSNTPAGAAACSSHASHFPSGIWDAWAAAAHHHASKASTPHTTDKTGVAFPLPRAREGGKMGMYGGLQVFVLLIIYAG